MIKLKNLKGKIIKNFVLVEIINDTDHLTVGSIDVKIGVSPSGEKYAEAEQSVRRGYVVVLPKKIDYSEAGTPFYNSARPDVGDVVYFDYLTGLHCEKATYQGKIYYIIPYYSLILALNSKMDVSTIKMLNGNILAQKVLKERSSKLEIKDTFFEDRFTIKKIGECNYDYMDGSIDDDNIKEGDVVLTKFKNYPELEPAYQLRMDGDSYIYFKRNTIIGVI